MTTTAAVLGVGRMGAPIAGLLVDGGWTVRVTASRASPAEAVRQRVVERLSSDGAHRVIMAADASEAARGAAVIVECLPEVLAIKQRGLAAAQAVAPGTLLLTNTSSLRVTEIATALDDPTRLVASHFVNPPDAISVVEVVPGLRTSADAVEQAWRLLEALGKTPVLVHNDPPGFVLNRLQMALLREAAHLVATEAVSADDLDMLVRAALGRRWSVLGPLETVALGGPELFLRLAEQLLPTLDNSTVPNPALVEIDAAPERLEQLRQRRADGLQPLPATERGRF